MRQPPSTAIWCGAKDSDHKANNEVQVSYTNPVTMRSVSHKGEMSNVPRLGNGVGRVEEFGSKRG